MRPSFGIGVLFWRLESPHGDPSKADEFLDYIVELQPKAVWLSFGANLRHWVDTFLERDDRRREEAGELEPAVAVRHTHHGDLDALIAQPSDAPGPFSLDRCLPFELEPELAKEINRPFEVIDDDPYIVHPFKRHPPNLERSVWPATRLRRIGRRETLRRK